MGKKERKENVEREIWDWERRKSQEEMKRNEKKEKEGDGQSPSSFQQSERNESKEETIFLDAEVVELEKQSKISLKDQDKRDLM